MKWDMQIEGLGQVTYVETAWLGKKRLFVNGQEATKRSRGYYVLDDQIFTLSGNDFSGVILGVNGNEYVLVEKLKWYELLLAIIPLFFGIVWSNVQALFLLLPLVGGALGAAIGVSAFCLQLAVMRKCKKPWLKIAVSLVISAAAVLLQFLLALLLILILG